MKTIATPIRRVATLTSTLSTLMDDQSSGPHISIYQAAGRLPEEAAQARVQLKVLLQNAGRQLAAQGIEEAEIDSLFESAASLCSGDDKEAFWNRQEGGLALFINRSDTVIVPVGRAFENQVIVSGQFHLKPLMALAANVDAYHLLAISQNEVKLFRGSALGIREIETDDLPSSYKDTISALGYPADSFADSAAESHLKVDDAHLKVFFKQIDESVYRLIKDTEWPLLLAGDTSYERIYREINRYPYLSEAYLSGNPEHTGVEDLHREATKLLKSDFIDSQKRMLIQLAKIDDPEHIETDIAAILAFAKQGRMQVLVIPTDTHAWGTYDKEASAIHSANGPSMSHVDLYESAARLSLQHGAEVFFLKANQIPRQAPLIAKLRW